MNTITIDRALVEQALEALFALRAFIRDDALACSYQTLGQYRTALLRAIDCAALAQPAPEPETCTWHQDGDIDSGVYATSCGRYFNLEDGTPEDNRMEWCCYCGKKLAQELITEGGDD